MNHVKVKICGITRVEDLRACVEAGADAVGFIIGFPESARNLSLTQAARLSSLAPPFIYRVAVTPIDQPELLHEICKQVGPDALQLHGRGSLDSKDLFKKVKLIRAIRGGEGAVQAAEQACANFDAVILDSLTERGIGGSGIIHDWNIGRKVRDRINPKPLILAGGLTPQNVRKAISKVSPFAVDVSSGVEKTPGRKDHGKVKAFISEAKGVL